MLFATIISRLLSFIASWIALQLIDTKELGIVLFAFNIISFILPFAGLGLHQGLLRYGSLLENEEEKNSLFIFVLKKGLKISFGIALLIVISSFIIPFNFTNTKYYLAFLSLVIIPHYILSIIKIQFRLKQDNKTFSYMEIVYNIIQFILIFLLSYFLKEKGYSLALLLSPILASIIFIKKLKIDYSKKLILPFINFKFWEYGFFASLAVSFSQFLIAIDIILIGYLLNNSEAITQYKYITLIPYSLLFLSQVVINTDFVTFTENISNKNYIHNYIKRYMRFFGFISFFICLASYLFSNQILQLFEPSFKEFSDTFLILIFGICGILIFRGLFGNLLSSIGKVHINNYIAGMALIINIISNYILIPKYGIKGAAITSSLLMWLTGLISYIWFLFLYKKFHSNEKTPKIV